MPSILTAAKITFLSFLKFLDAYYNDVQLFFIAAKTTFLSFYKF
jgi:hypothetical protein